jgi:hypothetical protein
MGTSVRAGAKALKQLGLIDAYGWAFDMETLIQWLCWHGPIVSGTNWYSSMFDRDAEGFLRIAPRATVVGGHCTLYQGWDEQKGAVVGLTSWPDFGRFLLSGEDAERLLKEQGEACSPTDTPIGNVPHPSTIAATETTTTPTDF